MPNDINQPGRACVPDHKTMNMATNIEIRIKELEKKIEELERKYAARKALIDQFMNGAKTES